MKSLGLVLCCLLCLAGCVSAINAKEAQIHFEAAHRYDLRGDYVSARDHYWKALVNAHLAKLDPSTISMLSYNFGRTAGYTCRLDVAEKHLLESLEMERSVTGPDSSISTKRIFELARFYYDQANYAKAAAYYEQGIPKVVVLGIEETDPIAFADALDEYSQALSHAMRANEAAAPKGRAATLRAKHREARASFQPERYKCRQ